LSPKEIASVIQCNQDWHPDGHGNYPTKSRPYLRGLIHSERFSNTTFELTIALLTAVSTVLIFLVAISGNFQDSSYNIISTLATIYPDSPAYADAIVMITTSIVAFLGLCYFIKKTQSKCPACNRNFALRSQGRYYRPINRIIEWRSGENTKQADAYEVKYGVHIFNCDDCGKWHVVPKKWENKLSKNIHDVERPNSGR
jgi:hypothetical protein